MIHGVICGPTGIGKSRIAINYALEHDCEIISADSRQVYAGVPVGTAQVSQEERDKVPHHLMGFLKPDDGISHQQYRNFVDQILKENPGKKFLLVGGTGLYIKSVLYQQSEEHVIVSENVVKEVKQLIRDAGLFHVYEKLKLVDEAAAFKIHPNDVYRVTKAYEYYLATGEKYSDCKMQQKESQFLNVPIWRVSIDREELYARINQRVVHMVENGWLDEVKWLMEMYPDESLGVWNALGYRELSGYFRGNVDLEEVISQIQQKTRRFAKRQVTFFRHQFPESEQISAKMDGGEKKMKKK